MWLVENPTEFVPYTYYDNNTGWNDFSIEFRTYDMYDDEVLIFKVGRADWNNVESLHGSYETVMVPAVMRHRTPSNGIDEDISFIGLY